MKVEEVKIRGSQGEATLSRTGRQIVAQVESLQVRAVWDAGVRAAAEQETLARRLQHTLDGFRGSNGDVASYRTVVELFAE